MLSPESYIIFTIAGSCKVICPGALIDKERINLNVQNITLVVLMVECNRELTYLGSGMMGVSHQLI